MKLRASGIHKVSLGVCTLAPGATFLHAHSIAETQLKMAFTCVFTRPHPGGSPVLSMGVGLQPMHSPGSRDEGGDTALGIHIGGFPTHSVPRR